MAFSSSTTRTPERATVLGRLRPVVKQSSSAGMERSESKCLFRGRDAEIKCNATRIIKRDEILTIGQFLDGTAENTHKVNHSLHSSGHPSL